MLFIINNFITFELFYFTNIQRNTQMKKYFFHVTAFICMFMLSALMLQANEAKKTLPNNIKVKDLTGKTIDVQNFDNQGKPIVISFWATWCKPCLEELNTINDLYADWQEKTGVKIIAVSIDDSRNSKKVAPFVKAKDWQYEVYLDENSDLKRALGINNPPHTLLLDGNKNIVYEHNGFASGDELKLYEQIKKLLENDKKE